MIPSRGTGVKSSPVLMTGRQEAALTVYLLSASQKRSILSNVNLLSPWFINPWDGINLPMAYTLNLPEPTV